MICDLMVSIKRYLRIAAGHLENWEYNSISILLQQFKVTLQEEGKTRQFLGKLFKNLTKLTKTCMAC